MQNLSSENEFYLTTKTNFDINSFAGHILALTQSFQATRKWPIILQQFSSANYANLLGLLIAHLKPKLLQF